MGETFTTHNPTFKWDDFKSPEYKSHESRSLWMAVVQSEPPKYEWIPLWKLWEGNPVRNQVTVGAEPDAVGSAQLPNGRYKLFLSYDEERRFGDLRLRRQSISVTPFSLKSP